MLGLIPGMIRNQGRFEEGKQLYLIYCFMLPVIAARERGVENKKEAFVVVREGVMVAGVKCDQKQLS